MKLSNEKAEESNSRLAQFYQPQINLGFWGNQYTYDAMIITMRSKGIRH